ncbi:molybdopterin converting factor subunit 1 [Ketobacter sp.]|uniref:molybdopterin converting factor subunit 1 n=1 Tax=Ketobacter sp. TaxID=2083498 RepID=UPI000F1FE8C4|nr:molybdopterin converting factor subunit 1 [Ketobacter sp.]RLT97365.1 MAG: molybdopterin converting factor subunit 1 [Ketobacter sp.]
MIKVLFFARVRDQVGCNELEVELPDTVSNVGAFTDLLKSRNQACRDALSNPNILVAVNQEMASSQTTVEDGDEIAYFPPVTGG